MTRIMPRRLYLRGSFWDIVSLVEGFRFETRAGAPFLAAHRGASDRALENSLEAFSLSVADGADMIELDVRLSADGEPAVLHDEKTGRTARENLRVDRCDAERLRKVRLKNGEPVPFLADVLDLVRGTVPLNIESKVPGGIAAAARAVDAARYPGEVLLSSRLRGECEAARSLRPDVPCGLVTGRPSASDIAFCLRRSLPSIHPDHRRLSVLRIRRALEAGLLLVPYTVDDPDVFFALVEAGARGVFSNRAEALRRAWRERPRGAG
jgi:glycerophosphoryl diester phosphodiesterase